MADLHSETGKHQDQVKVLIERTASSLDDTVLKMLFVSVQQNNIELSVKCAIISYDIFLYCSWDLTMTFFSLIDKIGVYSTVCPHHCKLNDCKAKLNSGGIDIAYTVMVWTFICEWMVSSLNWVFTMEQIPVSINTQFVSMFHLWISSLVNIHFRRVSADADKKKGYVNPIMILNLCCLRLTCGSECECKIILNNCEN